MELFDNSQSVSFKDFGNPTYQGLYDKAITRGVDPAKLRRVDMPGKGTEFRDPREHFVSRRIFRPIEFQHSDKGEDRIFAGDINGFPALIVADGVSGGTSPGDGGIAAEETTLTTVEIMTDILKPGLDSTQIYSMLEAAYKNSSANLKEKNFSGGTTLLIGFLYEHEQDDKPPMRMWYYAYKGDGDINIISPRRRVDGITMTTYLVTPQKVSGTAGVSAMTDNFSPVFGSVVYTPDDIMYANSDGMSYMDKWLRDKRQMANLSTVISVTLKGGLRDGDPNDPALEIADTIKDYPFGDDAVLGIIGTKMK